MDPLHVVFLAALTPSAIFFLLIAGAGDGTQKVNQDVVHTVLRPRLIKRTVLG